MGKFGKAVIRAADEAVRIARGDADPKRYRVHLPANIDAKAVRAKLGLSQAEFARAFRIPKRTLQDWEQRRSLPDAPAQALLRVIAKAPGVVQRALTDARP